MWAITPLNFYFPFFLQSPTLLRGERKGRVGAIFLTPTRKRNSKIKMEWKGKMVTLSKKKIPPSHAFRGIKFQGNTPPPFCHIKKFRRKYSNFLYKKSLDRCTSTDIENLILEFDAQKNSDYDFESAEKRLSRVLQEERLRLFEFPSLSLFPI